MPYRTTEPDLILTGGIVHTMNAHDLTATAIAIKDGKIVGVGSDDEAIQLGGMGTVREDLAGRTVIPGLIDAHNHLLATGRMLPASALRLPGDCGNVGRSQPPSSGKSRARRSSDVAGTRACWPRAVTRLGRIWTP